MVTILNIDTIVSDPAVRGGRPVIAGTTLRVSDLAAWYIFNQMSPDELAANFNLTLAQAHAALAYYYAHKTEIDEELRANAAEAEGWLKRLKEQGRLKSLD